MKDIFWAGKNKNAKKIKLVWQKIKNDIIKMIKNIMLIIWIPNYKIKIVKLKN